MGALSQDLRGYPPGRETACLLLALCIGILLFPAPSANADDTLNPHETRITECTDCHTEEIYTEDCHQGDGFCLTAQSVDSLCLLCHMKEECCRLGQDHQSQLFLGERSHPSDVAVKDVNPAHLPRTLPIHNGRITCRTCHLHSRVEVGDYKMLRLVKLVADKVDWTALCQDCHENY